MRCLLITPERFYLFHEHLAKGIERRGYDVSVVNDEYPNNIIGVLLGNFLPFVSKLLTFIFFKSYFRKNSKYDIIIIIKGRGISNKTIHHFRKHTRKIIGYNFDSFKYNPNPLSWMNDVDKYATFDHQDSIDHKLKKIELFASVENIESIEKKADLSVVLKNHSDRLLYLDQVSSLFNKIKSEIFIYEKNIFTFLKNFIAHPVLNFKWRKYISFKPLDYSSYLDMINRSVYTLDYAHPKQTGTTIRCFEALACKTKIITNNMFIFENSAFNNDNVIIHSLNGDVKELYKRMKEKSNKSGEFKPRSIDDFIDEILE